MFHTPGIRCYRGTARSFKLSGLFVLIFLLKSLALGQTDSCTVYFYIGELRKPAAMFDYNKFLFKCDEFTTVRIRLAAGEHGFSDNLRPFKVKTVHFEKDSTYYFRYGFAPFAGTTLKNVKAREIHRLKKYGDFFRNDPARTTKHIHTYKDEPLLWDSLCNLRRETARILKTHATDSLRKITGSQFCNEWRDSLFTVYKPFSWRELIVFDFLLGNYDPILERVRYNDDYFSQGGYWISYFDYCPQDLLYEMEAVYESYTDQINKGINSAALSPEEKALLTTYWSGILIYLRSEGKLPGSLQSAGTDFTLSYPESEFGGFVRRNFIHVRKEFFSEAFLLRADYGISGVNGNLRNYLTQQDHFALTFGYKWKRSTIVTGYCQSTFGLKQNFPLYDTISVHMGEMQTRSILYEYKYAFVEQPLIDLNVLAGTRISGVAFSDYSGIYKSNIHLYGGMEINVVIVPRLFSRYRPEDLVGRNEERNRSIGNLMLSAKAIYAPNPFGRAFDVNGHLATFSLGLQYEIGNIVPVYRKRRLF